MLWNVHDLLVFTEKSKLKNFVLKCQIKVSDKLAIPISHAKMIAKILIDAKKGAKFGFKTKVHKQSFNFLLVH